MKWAFKRAVALFALGALCFSLFACGNAKREHTYICGEKIYFATEKEVEAWREPLFKLLSNVEAEICSDDVKGEIIGYEAPNPELPSIADGCACALYDINLDGIPELLVDRGGGSAGNSCYEVYDIYTGENVCSIDGAQGASLCAYYYSETDEIKNVNRFSWRGGWSSKLFFTTVFAPGTYEEKSYLYSAYSMDMVKSGEDIFDIVCTGAKFEVNGESSEPESYLFEESRFEENCIRIKETELCYVYWWNVTENDDSPRIKGEKMTEALLSSGQKFIFFGE
ncbi:MAG: hypothetical protein IJX55_06295 [Clostridia bacterium]|nr:hypothetical protein [Clostridia bacterium]